MITPKIISMGKTVLSVRREKGNYVGGFFQKGKSSKFTVTASVQPITGEEILQVEEGDRAREHINIYTTDDLQKDDTVIYLCREFEVQTIETWENQNLRLTHKKARAVLKDVNKEHGN